MIIEKFKLNEFNSKDIKKIKSEEISKNFTIAIEFELETDDMKNYEITFEDFDYDTLDEFRSICYTDLPGYGIDIRKNKDFINDIVDTIETYLDEDLNHKKLKVKVFQLLDHNNYDDKNESHIIEILYKCIKIFLLREDLEYLKHNVEYFLPNFYIKYEKDLDFVLDASLNRGIEFKPKTYFLGLEKTLTILNDFFDEYNKQDYWKFTPKTGLHINIGLNDKEFEDFNAIKGLVMLDDYDFEEVPFVFKDMLNRMNNKYCDSLKKSLLELKEREKRKFDNLDLHDIKKVEDFFNEYLIKYIVKEGVKSFGFNIGYLKIKNYIEYRFIGGEINKELIISKLLYFCYITHLMTSDYKQKDYHKKLYKFLEELKNKKENL